MDFKKVPGAKIWIAETSVCLKVGDWGKPQLFTITLRVDARGSKVRVDCDKAIGMWEAIDGTAMGFADVDAAKAFAEQWRSEVHAQGTLSPRIG